MQVFFGIIILIFSLIAWAGQMISALSPGFGATLGLIEAESDVDQAFFIDQRGEAVWDSFVLWPMLVAGILLLLDNKHWPFFGIIGGAIFVYFSGRGIITRIFLKRKGIRIGQPGNLKTNLIFLSFWMVMGAGTMFYAIKTL